MRRDYILDRQRERPGNVGVLEELTDVQHGTRLFSILVRFEE